MQALRTERRQVLEASLEWVLARLPQGFAALEPLREAFLDALTPAEASDLSA